MEAGLCTGSHEGKREKEKKYSSGREETGSQFHENMRVVILLFLRWGNGIKLPSESVKGSPCSDVQAS